MTRFQPLRAQPQATLATKGDAVRWCVWARATSVGLMLGVGSGRHVLPMTAEDDGCFSREAGSIASGTRHAYRLGDSTHDIPYPASRKHKHMYHGASLPIVRCEQPSPPCGRSCCRGNEPEAGNGVDR